MHGVVAQKFLHLNLLCMLPAENDDENTTYELNEDLEIPLDISMDIILRMRRRFPPRIKYEDTDFIVVKNYYLINILLVVIHYF